MRSVDANLAGVGLLANRNPISRVTLEASRLNFQDTVLNPEGTTDMLYNVGSWDIAKTTSGYCAAVRDNTTNVLRTLEMTAAEITGTWPGYAPNASVLWSADFESGQSTDYLESCGWGAELLAPGIDGSAYSLYIPGGTGSWSKHLSAATDELYATFSYYRAHGFLFGGGPFFNLLTGNSHEAIGLTYGGYANADRTLKLSVDGTEVAVGPDNVIHEYELTNITMYVRLDATNGRVLITANGQVALDYTGPTGHHPTVDEVHARHWCWYQQEWWDNTVVYDRIPDVYPVARANGDVAIAADGDNVDLWYFTSAGLIHQRSSDGGTVFGAATTAAAATADGWLHCGTTSPNCVAWTKPYTATIDGKQYCDIMLTIYTPADGEDDPYYTNYTWTLRQKLEFNHQDLRVSVAKIGDRYLVVYSPLIGGKDVDIHGVWFEQRVWSNHRILVQLDTESGTHYCKGPMLSVVNGYVWLFYSLRLPYHSDAKTASQLLACIHSEDGDNWSEMDVLIDDEGIFYTKLLTCGTAVVCLYHEPANSGKTVFRCLSRGITMTGNLHPLNTLDISDDVSEWSLDLPGDSAGASDLTVHNSHLRYASLGEREHDLLMVPCKVIIEAGYRVNGVDYYTTMATHDLYISEHVTSFTDNELNLTGNDYAVRGELWRANREHIYDSQKRIFDNLREQDNTTQPRGLWKGSGNGLEGYLSGPSIFPQITKTYMQLYGGLNGTTPAVTIDGAAAPVGTEILVVSPRGHVVGAVSVSTKGEIPVLSVYEQEILTGDQAITPDVILGQYSPDPTIIPGMVQQEPMRFIVGGAAVASSITFDHTVEGYKDITLAALTSETLPTVNTTIRRAQAVITSSTRTSGILRYRCKLVGDHPTGYIGVGIDMENDPDGIEKEKGYIIVYDRAVDRFKVFKESRSLWGDAVCTQTTVAPVGLDITNWLHVMVYYWYGVIKVYYSLDGVNWTYALTYTDTDPLDAGYASFELQGITGDGVWFTDMVFCDMQEDWSLGDIIQSVCYNAGIEDVVLDHDLFDDFASALASDTWTDNLNLTCSISDSLMHCTGIAASATGCGYLSSLDAPNFIGSMQIVPGVGEGGFLFNCDAAMHNAYMATIQAGYVNLYRMESGIVSRLWRSQIPYPPDTLNGTPWTLEISRQDNFIGLWLNGSCILAYYTATAALETTNHVGITVFGTAEVDFDEFHVAELDDYVESHVVGIGDSATRVFADLMDKRHIRWFITGDGALRASRFNDRVAAVEYEQSIIESVKTPSNKEWFTHVQVVGADRVGDRINLDTLVSKGYRFVKIDNPDVMTSNDTYVEATAIQTESEERANLREFSAPAVVEQERQDLIKIINGKDNTGSGMDFTVQALSYEYSIDGDKLEATFDMTLQGTLALERVKKIYRTDTRQAYISAKIVKINTVTRTIEVQVFGSNTRIKGVSIPLTMNMDNLRIGDLVLLALVNGVYFILQAYKGNTPSDPYRWHWYADPAGYTGPPFTWDTSLYEVFWDNDNCTLHGRVAFWG